MWAKSSTTRFALRVQDCQQSLVKSFLESERTDKRRRIHEYLRFRAAVKTDAGTATAATLTRVRCGLPVILPEC